MFCNLNTDKLSKKINKERSCLMWLSLSSCREGCPRCSVLFRGRACIALKGCHGINCCSDSDLQASGLGLRGLHGRLEGCTVSIRVLSLASLKFQTEQWDLGLIFCCTWWQCRDSPQLDENVGELLTVRGQYQISHPRISAVLLILRILGDGGVEAFPFLL